MDMFVMGLCFTFFCLAVTAAAFAAATRPETSKSNAAESEFPVANSAGARFFANRVTPPIPTPIPVPIEALLQQFENHVRLEQAAAESFVALPSHAQLHIKTTSTFVN